MSGNPDIKMLEMHDVAVGTMHDPEKIVVKDVNWTVAAGEFWVIAARMIDSIIGEKRLMAPQRR